MPSPRQIVVALLEEEDDDISPEEVAASATLPVPPDFAMPQGLSREGQRAWQVIVGLLAEHDALNSGGHTHVFYTPQEWADRGEQYGNGSELIVVHDGGDHARFFNADYNGNGTTLMLKALSKVGCYPPPMTSWSTAIHCDKKLQEAEEFDPQELVYGIADPLYPDHEACGRTCGSCGEACTKIHRNGDREPYRSKHLCARCDLDSMVGSLPESAEEDFDPEEIVFAAEHSTPEEAYQGVLQKYRMVRRVEGQWVKFFGGSDPMPPLVHVLVILMTSPPPIFYKPGFIITLTLPRQFGTKERAWTGPPELLDQKLSEIKERLSQPRPSADWHRWLREEGWKNQYWQLDSGQRTAATLLEDEDEDEFSAEEVVSGMPSAWIRLEYVYRNQWDVLVMDMDAGYLKDTVGRIYYQPEKPEPIRWLASPYHGQQKEFRTPTKASNWMVGVPDTFPNREYSVDLSALPEELRS